MGSAGVAIACAGKGHDRRDLGSKFLYIFTGLFGVQII